jgi:hypothetical protein
MSDTNSDTRKVFVVNKSLFRKVFASPEKLIDYLDKLEIDEQVKVKKTEISEAEYDVLTSLED